MSANLIQSILAMPFSLRQRRLAKERVPLSKAEFVARVSDMGGDQDAARLMHEKLNDWVYAQGFTPYPDDDLGKVYGMAEEELDEDLILSIFQQLGVPQPSKERIASFGVVDTPLRVAQLVEAAKAR